MDFDFCTNREEMTAVDLSFFATGESRFRTKVEREPEPAEELNADQALPSEDGPIGPIPDAHQMRAAKMIKTTVGHVQMIRMISDKTAELLLPWHFETGVCYHCMSYGGIDLWSYAKHILRQQRLRYLMISSWIVSPDDAREIKAAVEAGDVGRVDFYVGDILQGGYRGAYDICLETAAMCGGRVAIFHNHAKIILGFGDSFPFVMASSCNLNINPRLEQTDIYTDGELAAWYKDYFDGIHAFNRDFPDWHPWEGQDGTEAERKNRKAAGKEAADEEESGRADADAAEEPAGPGE